MSIYLKTIYKGKTFEIVLFLSLLYYYIKNQKISVKIYDRKYENKNFTINFKDSFNSEYNLLNITTHLKAFLKINHVELQKKLTSL